MEFRYEFGEKTYTVRLDAQPDGSYIAFIDGRTMPVTVQHTAGGQINFTVSGVGVHAYTAHNRQPQTGSHVRYIALADRETCFYEVTKSTATTRRRAAGASSGTITSQMPGQVMDVFVAEGDGVSEGDPLLLLEAMKMEIRVDAPCDGIISRLVVTKGDTVERGQLLAEVT